MMQAAAPPINYEERHLEARKTRITSSKDNIVGGFSSISHAVSCQQVSLLPLILKQKTTVGSSRAKRSDLLPRSLNQCHAFPTHVPRFIVKPAVSHPCQSSIKNWINKSVRSWPTLSRQILLSEKIHEHLILILQKSLKMQEFYGVLWCLSAVSVRSKRLCEWSKDWTKTEFAPDNW